MQTRIYVVVEKESGTKRLVEAATSAQAIRHVVANKFEATVAGAKEIASLMRDGYVVEVAGAAAKNEVQEEAPQTE